MISARRLRAAAIAVALGVVLASSPVGGFVDGAGFDLLLLLRHAVWPAIEPQPSDRVAVVTLDEATYASDPFRELPLALWAPLQARVLDAIIDGGAAVVGYDLIFATSTEAVLKGYDRPFRQALRRAAGLRHVVLGEFAASAGPAPHPSYVLSVGADNLSPLEVLPDQDGVVRAIPGRLTGANGQVFPSFAAEIALRLSADPAAAPPAERMRIDLGATRHTVPSYSLTDLYACALKGDRDFFVRHFTGRAVLLGADLGVEDRHRAAHRFLPNHGSSPSARCVDDVPKPPPADLGTSTTAGVFLHAAAIDQFLSDRLLAETPPYLTLLLTVVVAVLAGLPPTLGQRAWVTRSPLYVLPPLILLAASAALACGLVLPAGRMLVATLTSLGIGFLYRAGLIDRDRWRLRRTLGLYLPEPELNRLHAAGTLPELGGETRVVTIVFVDIANFSRLAESSSPAEITQRLNAHFERLAGIVERHGGIVDRYVGDAIVALFGAPVPHPDHAARAVAAAVEIARKDPHHPEQLFPPFDLRVGVTTGPTLVGNIGSRRRFNYTAIGDTVNLASRIEGLNKLYGSSVLVSRSTVEGCPGRAFREVDRVRVVGRGGAVDLFIPLREPASLGDADRLEAVFSRALRLYRARAFDAAAALLGDMSEVDLVANALLERCRRYQSEPPPPQWDGTYTAESK